MTSATFSAADTGAKTADPYRDANLDTETSIKGKVEDLVTFVEGLKFGLMTTRQDRTGMLVSRCMAVAAKVCSFSCLPIYYARY